MEEIAPGIVVDKAIRFGKPVLAGTRVPVDLVVGKLAGGMTIEEVAEEYELEPETILAVIAEFDAESRFRIRAAAGSPDEGLRLLDKLDRAPARDEHE